MIVPPEINNPKPGGILIVGKDDSHEWRLQPSAPAGRLLDQALTAAGMRRQDANIANVVAVQSPGNQFAAHRAGDVEAGMRQLHELVLRLRPNPAVALGNEAAYTLVPGWPSKTDSIHGAHGIQDRRGYLWNGVGGVKVLTTLHPATCLIHRDPSGIGGMLLVRDLERAKREAKCAELRQPNHTVHIVSNIIAAKEAVRALRGRTLAVDIECQDPQTLSCVGFAASTNEAFVFTPAVFGNAFELLADVDTPKVFQNGQFDVYFLQTRCGIEVASWLHDTMVAWHAAWPEIAGKGKSGSKKTQKSLAFLASVFCETPVWWKDYDEWESEADMYRLNGRDCCITLEVHRALQAEIDDLGVRGIYEHEMRMMPALVAVQQRGLRVDDGKRREVLETLEQRKSALVSEMQQMIQPLLQERRSLLQKPHLFFQWRQCQCCGGGSKKAAACWSCAGFEKAPSKTQMQERMNGAGHSMKKAELEAALLGTCAVCEGDGGSESFQFNPNSNDQLADVLYSVLKLPVRYNDGKPSVDESALKNSLGAL